MLARITHTDTPPSPVLTQRRQLAQIVAHESAETLVGRPAGLRVAVVRRLIRPVADHVAERFVTYDRALGEAGLRRGSAWIVDEATGGLAVEGSETRVWAAQDPDNPVKLKGIPIPAAVMERFQA